MVSLEQIRALEARVEKAVGLIDRLRKDNIGLEQRLAEAERGAATARADRDGFERRAEAAALAAQEAAARYDAVASQLRDMEDRIAEADLKAEDALERAAISERKAQAAGAELAAWQDRAAAAERRASELESRAEDLRREQGRIEDGLVSALAKLDAFEDLVMGRPHGADAMAPTAPDAGTLADPSTQEGIGFALEGDAKEKAADEPPSAPATQASTFPGAEHELDIF